MEVKNCTKCKRLFQYLTGPLLCPNCRDDEEKDFKNVKEYLKEHPKATITEVSEALDITVDRINRFLKEGRLEITPGSAIKLECESCGASIFTGRYCWSCSSKLEKDLSLTSQQLRDKANAQAQQSLMKYLTSDKK